MPFKSKAQRGWMWRNDPEMAHRWQEHTPKNKKLPQHAHESFDRWFERMISLSEASEPIDASTPSLPDPDAVGQEYERKPQKISAVQMQIDFDVGPLSGGPGDFLCKGSGGKMWPADPQSFMDDYELADVPMKKVFSKVG